MAKKRLCSGTAHTFFHAVSASDLAHAVYTRCAVVYADALSTAY